MQLATFEGTGALEKGKGQAHFQEGGREHR